MAGFLESVVKQAQVSLEKGLTRGIKDVVQNEEKDSKSGEERTGEKPSRREEITREKALKLSDEIKK